MNKPSPTPKQRAQKRNLAWHFVGEKLRDGQPVPADGVWLEHNGRLKLCESGLHWSRQPFDALQYAPGETLCLVEVGGEIIENKGDGKGISSKRKIIARMDATELLRYFARMQAISALEYWDTEPPEVVLDYLATGDESLRAAARAAAWAAARADAWDAAWAAAWAAARAAARADAWAAAWAAARAAARADALADALADAWADAWADARQHFNDLVYESFRGFL